MRTIDLERQLMPNVYVKQLGQEISDLGSLTAGTGIASGDLEHYGLPVTVAQSLAMLRNAVPLADRPDWHLKWGQRMGEHFHGPVSMAWLSAPTFGEGFDVFLKYIPSRVPYHHWQGYREGNTFVAEVVELMDFGNIRPIVIEVPILVMHEYARTLRPGSIADAHIELSYRAPVAASTYARWFQCPVVFGARRNALVFPHAWRSAPNIGHDEAMWNAACNRCRTLCGTEEARDTLSVIRQLLFDEIEPGYGEGFAPSLEALAQRMHCSPRTLIRRLRAMNTTYRHVVDKVKKQRACELLGEEHLRIHEIASALGYRDSGSFVRSFKRCIGMTPGQFRDQLWLRSRTGQVGGGVA